MRVYFKVVGDKLPYGLSGRRVHKGEKRSLVDFGKRGTFRVPNSWLSETKPDPELGRIAKEAIGLAHTIMGGK